MELKLAQIVILLSYPWLNTLREHMRKHFTFYSKPYIWSILGGPMMREKQQQELLFAALRLGNEIRIYLGLKRSLGTFNLNLN